MLARGKAFLDPSADPNFCVLLAHHNAAVSSIQAN